MDNLAYAVMASSTQMDIIVQSNSMLVEQLNVAMLTVMKLTDKNNKLIQIVEKSMIGGIVPGGHNPGGCKDRCTKNTPIKLDPE
eukprot:10645719-Ditylum_brightwellii.AAC.1